MQNIVEFFNQFSYFVNVRFDELKRTLEASKIN